jgi:integrase/recombinase XerD
VIVRVAAAERKSKQPFRRFRVDDLRHGFAIEALRASMNIYSLLRHLGHSSVRTTEIYLAYLSETEPTYAQTGVQTE